MMKSSPVTFSFPFLGSMCIWLRVRLPAAQTPLRSSICHGGSEACGLELRPVLSPSHHTCTAQL